MPLTSHAAKSITLADFWLIRILWIICLMHLGSRGGAAFACVDRMNFISVYVVGVLIFGRVD